MIIVPVWVVVVLIGWAIGATKGRGAFGLIASVFLGPLGWVFAILARPARPRPTKVVEAPVVPVRVEPPAPGPGTIVERYGRDITGGAS